MLFTNKSGVNSFQCAFTKLLIFESIECSKIANEVEGIKYIKYEKSTV